MMKKTIKAKGYEPLKQNKGESKENATESPKPAIQKGVPLRDKVKEAYEFPKGSKFMLQGTIYYVRDTMFEMNTEMRMVQSHSGEEIFTLATLQQDAVDDPDFLIPED